MTITEFIRQLAKLAKAEARPVLAIDFAPSNDGIALRIRFKDNDDHR